MSKPNTWMPLYIGDYLRKTMRLNAEQHGAYLLLLMAYWQDGPLPDDDDQLAAIARLDGKGWAKVSKVVRPYFRSEGGQLHHDNAERLKQEAMEKYEKRSKAGSNNVAKRYQQPTNGTATEYQSPPQSQPQSQASNEANKNLLADFEEWYSRFPRKAAKGAALKAYRLARKKTDAATLLAGIETYRRIKPDYADWAHPATWLNGERWLDEAPAASAKSSEAAPDPLANEKLAAKDVLEGRAYYRQTVPLTAYRSAIAKGIFTLEQAKAAGVSL